LKGRFEAVQALKSVSDTRRYGAGFSVRCRRPDSLKSQVSPSMWPEQAHSVCHRSSLGERHRDVGAELFSGFALVGGNLSNPQGG
jgi:uncharacterized protein (DUF1800 family)